jgi:hypothetical protein
MVAKRTAKDDNDRQTAGNMADNPAQKELSAGRVMRRLVETRARPSAAAGRQARPRCWLASLELLARARCELLF